MTEPASCSCSDQVKKLLAVNQCWKSDYGELMAQNQNLKAEIASYQQQRLTTSTHVARQLSSTQNVQCTVEEIENLKEQINIFKEKYQQEFAERLLQEKRAKSFEEKYQKSEERNAELRKQIESFKFKIEIMEDKEETRAEKTFQEKLTQQLTDKRNKAALMEKDIFPKKRHCDDEPFVPKDIDERDNTCVLQGWQIKIKNKKRDDSNL